uniref:Uncharacterized protein n=1 Tax=Rhizophora mucronata TaxID=61149 RepID=A0A2P2PYZ9_RHIMU
MNTKVFLFVLVLPSTLGCYQACNTHKIYIRVVVFLFTP